MAPEVRLRPMSIADGGAVDDLAMATLFQAPPDLSEPVRRDRMLTRFAHLVGTDPGGAWVAERDGSIAGVAMALVRDGVWGLSLLAVDESLRGRHVGRRLLEATLEYGRERAAQGWLILSSEHPAAMRLYARAGFDALPTIAAVGIPDLAAMPPAAAGVVDAGEAGIELAEAIVGEIRGAGHGPDLLHLLRDGGGRLLTYEDRAVAIGREGQVTIVAGRDEEAASIALWGALASAPRGSTAMITFITGAQQWAVRAALDARLPLSLDSPVMVRGELGPMAPYLPSAAFL